MKKYKKNILIRKRLYNKIINDAISRIKIMEEIFDILENTIESKPELILKKEYKNMYHKILKYYDTYWLNDYLLDEKGLLPSSLKRGVLSQDGIYNLIFKIKNFKF